MKVYAFILTVVLGGLGYYTYQTVGSLQKQIDSVEELNHQLHQDMASRSDLHSLQDSLEERIGTLERFKDDMEFIQGGHK